MTNHSKNFKKFDVSTYERERKQSQYIGRDFSIVKEYFDNLMLNCCRCHSHRLRLVSFHILELVSLLQRAELICDKCGKEQSFIFAEEDLGFN